jgi:tRNA uridine 5-carboxymethylaminomethyl modification enzyme
MLNRSKGPAVWGPRAQCDRALYPVAVRRVLDELTGLDLLQDMVSELVVEGDCARGVVTRSGLAVHAACVVVTAGTFLRGRIHVGGQPGVEAGRAGEAASVELARALEGRLDVRRFKTGTPPRVDGRTVDWTRVERQDGDPEDYRFAAYVRERIGSQLPCWITWTGAPLKEVVELNLRRSALYGGAISGRGPRYCPSIEDKIVRFPQAKRHQVFLEPEGIETTELYVNGLSTSLPPDVQVEFLRTVPGLEEARVTRFGYAIEYDYFPPHQLRHTLETRVVARLFLAGQVNGTTGYEEAAGQGIVAGINAALATQGRPPLVLRRDQSYIGVLVDDLVTRGVDEPYRLFTSRAEYRLLLRQDNAIRRLGPLARELGLLTPAQDAALEERLAREDRVMRWFQATNVAPADAAPVMAAAGSSAPTEPTRASELMRRPGVDAAALASASGAPFEVGSEHEALAAVEVELRYEGYVRRERERAGRLRAQEEFALSPDLPYQGFISLSTEAREKLARLRPDTLGQAGRIPGISPSDLHNLVLEVRRARREAAASS